MNGKNGDKRESLLFGLAVSFVNAHKGCTWVPKVASDRLCGWMPFGKYRRESAHFPEDSVTPRYEGLVT